VYDNSVCADYQIASPTWLQLVEIAGPTETLMEELYDLKLTFDALAADNKRLAQLWETMDLNSNGELGFTEVTKYMERNHMILANVPVLRNAYRKAIDMDDDDGSNVVKPEHFRAFLGHIFQSAEEYVANQRVPMDAPKERVSSKVATR
jgi:hypothetical protein